MDNDPRHRLAHWLRENGRSGAWLARQVGCSPSMVSALKRADRRVTPGLRLAAEIERVTGIPAMAWVA